MDYQTIILEKKEHIATITLNRPDRLNAFNSQMDQELLSALDDVDKDDEMRVLVLTGAGRAFCSGADVGGMAGGAERGTGTSRGVCVGAGAEIAFACDMRMGSGNARFMNAFVRIGLVPGWGGCWSYPRVMGLGKAFEYLFSNSKSNKMT